METATQPQLRTNIDRTISTDLTLSAHETDIINAAKEFIQEMEARHQVIFDSNDKQALEALLAVYPINIGESTALTSTIDKRFPNLTRGEIDSLGNGSVLSRESSPNAVANLLTEINRNIQINSETMSAILLTKKATIVPQDESEAFCKKLADAGILGSYQKSWEEFFASLDAIRLISFAIMERKGLIQSLKLDRKLDGIARGAFKAMPEETGAQKLSTDAQEKLFKTTAEWLKTKALVQVIERQLAYQVKSHEIKGEDGKKLLEYKRGELVLHERVHDSNADKHSKRISPTLSTKKAQVAIDETVIMLSLLDAKLDILEKYGFQQIVKDQGALDDGRKFLGDYIEKVRLEYEKGMDQNFLQPTQFVTSENITAIHERTLRPKIATLESIKQLAMDFIEKTPPLCDLVTDSIIKDAIAQAWASATNNYAEMQLLHCVFDGANPESQYSYRDISIVGTAGKVKKPNSPAEKAFSKQMQELDTEAQRYIKKASEEAQSRMGSESLEVADAMNAMSEMQTYYSAFKSELLASGVFGSYILEAAAQEVELAMPPEKPQGALMRLLNAIINFFASIPKRIASLFFSNLMAHNAEPLAQGVQNDTTPEEESMTVTLLIPNVSAETSNAIHVIQKCGMVDELNQLVRAQIASHLDSMGPLDADSGDIETRGGKNRLVNLMNDDATSLTVSWDDNNLNIILKSTALENPALLAELTGCFAPTAASTPQLTQSAVETSEDTLPQLAGKEAEKPLNAITLCDTGLHKRIIGALENLAGFAEENFGVHAVLRTNTNRLSIAIYDNNHSSTPTNPLPMQHPHEERSKEALNPSSIILGAVVNEMHNHPTVAQEKRGMQR